MVVLLLTFVLLFSGIALLGYQSYQNYSQAFRLQMENQLVAIADLKAGEISAWLGERFGDAEVIKEGPAMGALVNEYIEDLQNEEKRGRLQHALDITRGTYKYESVQLLDLQGSVIIASPQVWPGDSSGELLAEEVTSIIDSGVVTLVDFQLQDSRSGQKNLLTVLAPIYEDLEHDKPLGIIALRVDPEKYLYPMINYWPTSSETAETLLVRREGDSVLYLTPLLFKDDAALELLIPLDETGVLAVKAVLGQTGVTEGYDYRGEHVIGALQQIKGTPWYMVARVDTAELYGPLNERLWQTIIFFGALFITAGAALIMLWRQQQIYYFKNQARTVTALRKSEAFNRAVLDHLPIGIAINTVEPIVEFAYMNDNFAKIYHTSREALADPDVFWNVVYEDRLFREEIKNRVIDDCASGDPERMIWHDIPITRDGNVVAYITAGNTPVPGKNMVISTVSDVTDRKKAEEELSNNFRLLQIAGQSAKFGGWYVDLGTNKATWSDEVAEIHDRPAGYSPPVAEGISYYAPEWQDRIQEVFLECAEKGVPYDEEMEIISFAGKRKWVRTIGLPVRNESGSIVSLQGAFQDISEQKKAAEEIRRLNEELEQRVYDRTAQLQAANEELEAFAYSVSHDLRAPLRSMSGFSEELLLKYDLVLDEQGIHYLKRIQASSKRMGHLIDGLLNLSRVTRTSINFDRVDLSAIAGEIAAELESQNSKRNVKWKIGSNLIVRGDRDLLRIGMENLIGNAWKFTAERQDSVIEVGMAEIDGITSYFIRDNGVGFKMAYINKLFKPFQRLHGSAEFSGTGIGLATVKRIITRHGGRVWADAAEGRGATFYFTLGGAQDAK